MSTVYFIQSGRGGPVKIGVTGRPAKRLKALQVGNPTRLALMAAIPGGYDLERELHARFASGHIADEWFAADTPGLIETVEHILRHGTLPDLVAGDQGHIGATCEACGWPMQVELSERGGRACWTCLKEAAK